MNKSWMCLLGLIVMTPAAAVAGPTSRFQCTLQCQASFPPLPVIPRPADIPPNATCTRMNPAYPACLAICAEMVNHGFNKLGCQAAVDARCAAAGGARKSCIEAGYAICNVLY